MEKNKISIIIAAHNVEKYIGNCIESIMRQTYSCFEIIIIDDGSSDKTSFICDRYAEMDARIICIHQDNKGVGFARNEGLKRATGQFVTFVDSDDEISEFYLERLIEPCLKEHVKISVCMYQYVIKDSEIYQPIICNSYTIYNVDYRILQAKIIGRCCGTLIECELLKNIFFQTDLYVGEDLLFFCTALKNTNKIAVSNDQLYCYYIYDESSYNGTYNDKKFTEMVSWNRVINLFSYDTKIFRNTILRLYGWILLSNILKMEQFKYNNISNKKYCRKELCRMIYPVFNWYPGGGNRSIAMYPIYIISCMSPKLGYFVFSHLMKLKHHIIK